MNGLSLFSGIGGIELALKEDVRTVGYVEWETYPQAVLIKRMREGLLDEAPIWGDIQTFDGKPWCNKVDIIFGGFPCTDISVAGKGAGIKTGTRSGLWFEMLRVIGEVRPSFVFLENVSAITRRGLDTVLGGLSEVGYDARWTTVRASDVGAPHRRERWFCLGWLPMESSIGNRVAEGDWEKVSVGEKIIQHPDNFVGASKGVQTDEDLADSEHKRWCGCSYGEQDAPASEGKRVSVGNYSWRQDPADCDYASESFVGRVADGIPQRVDRLKCLGNAVVPQQAVLAWKILTEK